MARPAVLIVEPEETRRRELCRGLASEGYEVVPATSGEEGVRFAQGLGPAVIVAPANLARFGDASILAELTRQASGMDRTLVLLGERAEEASEMPGEVVFLTARELAIEELVRRLRLVLIGREIGVAADARLESLVGDLAQKPLLELVRILHEALLSGRIDFDHGSIHFVQGNVIAAQAGRVSGLKAFCRLARLHEGSFRIVLELERAAPDPSRQIREDLNALINAAIQDSMGQYPDPQARLKLLQDPGDVEAAGLEQQLLRAARQGLTVQEALDSFGATDGDVVQTLLQLEERGLVKRLEVAAMVRVITDSAADLPVELARQHALAVIPARVVFGQKVYRDRIDLKPSDFYRILEQGIAHPETRPAEAEDVLEVYDRTCRVSDVVAIHVSSKTSSLYELGCQARDRLRAELPEDRRIEVVDSAQISLGLGLLALFAARLGVAGLDAEEVARRVRAMSPRVTSLAVVTTLEYLNRGGRVGKVQAFLGGLLGIKPLLSVENGEVVAIDKVRRRRKALDVMADQLAQRLDHSRPLMAAVCHANSPVYADQLRQMVEERYTVREMFTSEIGPGVGTHVGPGAFAVTVFQPTDEELALLAPPPEV